MQTIPETTTQRQAFRAAVAAIAARAQEKLPTLNGRIDSAVKLVLNRDVELLADGTAYVASQSDPSKVYHVNGTCSCPDYDRAPEHLCKHRLSVAIVKRAMAAMPEQPVVAHDTAADEPQAPQHHGIPAQHIVMIQGKPSVKYAGLLAMAQERGLVSLAAEWTFNDAELSLAHAVATFQDGRRFEESGDATPTNVTKKVAPHFRRVALTRAKARVLRDALGIDVCAVEELAEE
jgi:hypothetical protein